MSRLCTRPTVCCLVARLDGPTPAIARRLVDLAKQAERDGLWGRAYFDSRSITDPGYKIGDDWINGAAEMSRRLGLETVLDTNATTFPPAFPLSQVAYYLGWYDGDVSGPFAESASGVHARGLRLPPSFLQRRNLAQHQPTLGRTAPGQGR